MTELFDPETKNDTHTNKDSRDILGQLVHYRTYAATKSNGRKESRKEVVDRTKEMHQTKFPWLNEEIGESFSLLYQESVVPSMRLLQFSGESVWKSNVRSYNCCYAPLSTWKDFADLFWLLMNGCGVGYSVERYFTSKLPIISGYFGEIFVVGDSKEGWADGVIALLENPQIKFDVSKVRPKGAPISSGGTASGPESLLDTYEKIREILLGAEGRKLKPVECFDIMNHVAEVVVVGGVRRAATICLFDWDDSEMLLSKSGFWWKKNPQRARANISARILRDDPLITKKIRDVLGFCFDSDSGEPGISLTNDVNYGYNPCQEIALPSRSMCNLSEINVSQCRDEMELNEACRTAAIQGTLQASYTDFSYLHPQWAENCEKEALLGVSLTGQAMNWDLLTDEVLQRGAEIVCETNLEWAEKLGINPSVRLTTVKPSGNTSAWLGTTSGIHAAHSPYYLRRVRVDRKDAFGKYLLANFEEYAAESGNFLEEDKFNTETIVVTLPIHMPNAIYRNEETALELLERMKHVYQNWILPGHRSGANTHNVSLTLTYREHEKEEIADWMVENKDSWAGIALLPYDGGSYVQAPFEEITESEFYEWLEKVPTDIDFSVIDFSDYSDERLGDLGCIGSASCEIK